LPAASYARTVTTLSPTNNGIVADHAVVPLAVPEPPVDVVQVTRETATLSAAVPLTEIVADDVETMVEPGLTILSVGGTVSAPLVVPVPVLLALLVEVLLAPALVLELVLLLVPLLVPLPAVPVPVLPVALAPALPLLTGAAGLLGAIAP
jgi:hypothetical protein